jgi:midasin (ATPase involved in ribosome maturation)
MDTNRLMKELVEKLGLKFSQQTKRCSSSSDLAKELIGKLSSFNNGKGFVLTKDNFIKIVRIARKAILRIPVVISGETGCGKTHLINFLSSFLIEDEFRCFTLNTGLTEQQIIVKIEEYVQVAQNLKGKNNFGEDKNLWILIDEVNTSYHQSLIAEIVIERKSSFSDKLKTIPKNVIFISCCNPFRLDRSVQVRNQQNNPG